jgi:dipeptidyl aminopeptidase/acylaminoacyl peptidase
VSGFRSAAVAAALLLAASVGAGAPARGGRARGCGSPPALRTGSLGVVAYVWRRELHVVDLSSARDRTLARVVPQSIGWSPDGRWIAVGGTLVAAADGRTCVPFGSRALRLQWRPHSNTAVASPASGPVLVGGPDTSPRPLLPRGFSVGELAFDAAGRRLVAEGPRGSLWVVDLATGARTQIWRSSSPTGEVGLPVGVRWSPDGRWILFQTDPYGSGSIAADGLPLWAIRSSGGRTAQVEPRVLGGSDFLQACGRRVLISGGFDRYVSARKRVDLSSPPAWRARTISPDRRRSWYAATCSPDRATIAATVTTNREEGRFDTAERSIWLLGGRLRLLVGRAGDGYSDEQPRWSSDGRWILYVHHPAHSRPTARLYLVNIATGERRGPFAHVDGGLGYYGRHDWNGLAAWYLPLPTGELVEQVLPCSPRAAAAASARATGCRCRGGSRFGRSVREAPEPPVESTRSRRVARAPSRCRSLSSA